MRHDQVALIQGIQGWFDNGKFVSIICHIRGIKRKKNHDHNG